MPAPYWVSYIELIRMVGGVPVVVEATEAENFKITPEKLAAAITPKTKCMILNNPSNPTGMMYSRQELEAISKVCVEQDIYVISDEIYYGLVYDGGQFVSLAALGEDIKERTLLINGVSKSYAMTGWRIGYVAAPPRLQRSSPISSAIPLAPPALSLRKPRLSHSPLLKTPLRRCARPLRSGATRWWNG